MPIKKVILAVSGGIAAYKSAYLVRLMKKEGLEVKVVMTPSAGEFIGAVTLSTLSGNPVVSEIQMNGEWNDHVQLGLWADLMIVAPATANTIAKMANGICDNMLQAVYLSARCPVLVAPAMDLDMYAHPATKRNISILEGDGVQFIGPENGELASGLVGKGRMSEPEDIMNLILTYE